MRRIVRRIVPGLLAATAACMSGQGQSRSVPVSEADYGRVGAGQSRVVEDARQQRAAAQDELGRAKLRMMDDRHEGELAKSGQAAATAERSHAAAEGKIGTDSLEPGQVERARSDTKFAELQTAVADAHLRYAEKLKSSREAGVTAAERKVSLMDERVNAAKLQAMDEAGVPAAAKYDRAAAMEKVVQAQRRYDQARSTASEAEQQAAAAREHWQDLNRQRQYERPGGG
jgi:hypothetical protein